MSYPAFEEPYPFDDEPKPSSGRERFRSGVGRKEWNADTMWRYIAGPLRGSEAPACASCGYRDHRINMEHLEGSGLHCLPCFLRATNPAASDKFWLAYDALTGKPAEPPDPLKGTRTTLDPLPANFGTGRKR